MSELIRAGRKHATASSTKRLAQTIRMDMICGRFSFLDDLAKILDLSETGGIMFVFNQNAGRAYIYPENEKDSYYPRRSKVAGYRFSSKDLKEFFIRVFKLDRNKRFHQFIVNETETVQSHLRCYELIYVQD